MEEQIVHAHTHAPGIDAVLRGVLMGAGMLVVAAAVALAITLWARLRTAYAAAYTPPPNLSSRRPRRKASP